MAIWLPPYPFIIARSIFADVLRALVVRAPVDRRERQESEGGGADWVFCDGEGGALRKSNVRRRSFHLLVREAGVPAIRFHDLRHAGATLLLAQGVHPKVVQERLGHAQIAMTLDTYSQVLPSMQRDATDRLDAPFLAPVGAQGAEVGRVGGGTGTTPALPPFFDPGWGCRRPSVFPHLAPFSAKRSNKPA